ncbi:hypothetical protein [Flectobacillus roseus]|uniref:hypothetical protein n=1 Tax=Flectobacillus roseus TaxID=502259 RepID=UPI0024B755A2|nr:hypothetical protein [Flectobacillus roseus]MDI9870052.1 hypothetical protein [Flectobacillus roseus]
MENQITILNAHGQSFGFTTSDNSFLHEFLDTFKSGMIENEDALLIKNSIEIHNSIRIFIQKNIKVSSIEGLNKLISILEKLPEDNLFFIILGTLDTERRVKYLTKLVSLNPNSEVGLINYTEDLDFMEFIKIYNISEFGRQRRVIGEKGKCRFCKTSEGNQNEFGDIVTFKNKSHAISEALGNKKVTTKDECDACNKRFGREIEPSLVNFLKVYRSLYGIKGKNGATQLKGHGIDIDRESLSIKFDGNLEELINQEVVSQIIPLSNNESFVPLLIYKCLVKFTLGVLPVQEMQYFDKTLSWINGSKESSELYPIIRFKENIVHSEPLLTVMCKRVNDVPNLPYMFAEFKFANVGFVFIIPYCSLDSENLFSISNYNFFYEFLLKSVKKMQVADIEVDDFSSEERKFIKINVIVKNLKLGENAFWEDSNAPQ